MKVDFLSHTAMGGDFVVGSHHLATALASRGHEVRHVSAPITPAHVLALREPFVRRRVGRFLRGGATHSRVTDIVPFAPIPWVVARTRPGLMHTHTRWMLAAPLRSIGRLAIGAGDFLVVDEPRFVGVALERNRRATLAYRATDLYAAMRGDARIAEAERQLCRHADILVATSEKIATHLREISGRQAQVIGNGVDHAHFSTSRESGAFAKLPGERANRAVYVGAFDLRFCADSLRAAAQALPDRQFILAGPGGEGVVRAIALRNVHALGAVAYEQLPELLQQCAVGLLPFSTAAVNAGRSPMKLFEYAAAGLAVAATESFRQGKAAVPALAIARDKDGFASAVSSAFAMSRDDALVRATREAARSEDWAAKAAELLRLLQGARAELVPVAPPNGACLPVGN